MWNKTLLAVACAVASSSVTAHSPMFKDYFVFDTSNGGESVAPQRTLRALSSGQEKAQPREPCVNGEAAGYPCNNIDLMSFVSKDDFQSGGANLNDIWGWTDPATGAEIAIVGTRNSTVFVDVTDPEDPIIMGRLPSINGGADIWRDIKVYNDHAFIVADGNNNVNHGLQVFDLTQLRALNQPDFNLVETAQLTTFGEAHNIAINEDTGFAYVVGADRCSGGLYMVDISIPDQPTFAGCFSQDGYTHDAQCVVYNGPDTEFSGREICVAYNEDTITIVDVSDKANPTQISRTPYQGSRYTHQGWFLDDNHSIIIMNDELDEQRARVNTTSYIFDVSDLRNPTELGRYVAATEAIDHNLYTRDGLVFQANYRAGLRILSSADIANGNLEEVAFFDVIPNSDAAQFSGLWSSYVEFASGNIIMSDIGGGLFVVQPNYAAIDSPNPNDCLYEAAFETDAGGWTAGASSCSTGEFVRGTPQLINNGGVTTQLGTAAQGDGAWFTANNTSAGTDDVDGGTCEAVSPLIDASDAAAVEVALAYFHGQRDAGDDASDGFTIELLNDGIVVETLVSLGDERSNAQWRDVITQIQNPGELQLRIRATDGPAGGDLIEAGIDAISICAVSPSPEPSDCSAVESFEGGANDWLNTVGASCTTGEFVAAIPTAQSNGGVTTQVGAAADGTNALITATNTTPGNNDVDGGTCVVESPTFDVATASTLSMAYFHGQRDAGDDPNDFFQLEVSTDGGNSFSTIANAGDVTSNAQWQTVTAPVPAGSNVVVRMQCADGDGPGDLVECGLDNVRICPN